MQSFTIHPLHVGTLTRPMATFCYGSEPGRMVDVPLVSWLIKSSDRTLLIDTGAGDPAKANPHWMPYKRPKEQSLENALRNVGMRCGDIETVIMTHLHWDHCGEVKLFRHSKIFVQEEELQYALSPFPVHIHSYNDGVLNGIDYTIISGDKEIAPGLTAIFTPGHTYGTQGVLVEGEDRRYFIASDTIYFYKNLEQDPPLVSGAFVDLRKYYESLERIKRLSAVILPGHEIRVFEREVYS